MSRTTLATSDAATSYAALLIGGLIAFSLTGTVSVQCLVYYRLFPEESRHYKALVASIWFLDLLHSACIGASLYAYFILWFGDESQIDVIPWTIALSVLVTAAQTLIAHLFFANKIHRSSQKNLFLTGPVVILAFLRLIAAGTTTGEMIADKRYSTFTHTYPGWIFTTGLSLSAAVDVLIGANLLYLLRKLKLRMGPTSTRMLKVVDTLTLYTLENGLLTGVTTTATLICWIALPHKLIFLGLHFIIEKLYANSILASLNTRKELREMRPRISPWADPSLPVLSASDFGHGSHPPRDPSKLLNPLAIYTSRPSTPTKFRMPSQLEVNVQRVVEQETDSMCVLARVSHSNSVSSTYNQTPSNQSYTHNHAGKDSSRSSSPHKFDYNYYSKRGSRTPTVPSRAPTVLSWKQPTHPDSPDFDLPDSPSGEQAQEGPGL